MTIKLLIMISSFAVEGPDGGIERFGVELARRLNQDQFDITLCGLWSYDLDHEKDWMERLTDEGVNVTTTAPWTGSRRRDAQLSLRFLRQHFRQHSYDIVNSHTHFAHLAALLLRPLSGARATLRTVHNEREWFRQPRLGAVLNNLVFPISFNAEAGVSQKVVDALDRRPLARLLGRRARLMHNAIDHARFAGVEVDQPAKRQALGLPAQGPVIGTIGRFTQQKGFSYFIRAARQLTDRRPDAQFLMIGTGELVEDTQALAAELGLDNIHFLGTRTDVEELLAVMDVFVSSSLWEGLSTVILEAMAAGLPVVATNVSGSAELVQDKITGLLVPPADADALAAAVDRLLNNPDLARQLAQTAQQHSRNFSIESVAAGYEQLYLELWGGKQ